MFNPEVQIQVSRVRQDVVVIYVKQLMNMLGRIQQEQLVLDEQDAGHNAGDLRPDDLITNNDQIIANPNKSAPREDGQKQVDRMITQIQHDLELLPVLAASLEFAQINEIFVAFACQSFVNGYFVEQLQQSFQSARDELKCRLNILQKKLHLQFELGKRRQVERLNGESRFVTSPDVRRVQLVEVENLLLTGDNEWSDQLRGVIGSYVGRQYLKQLLSCGGSQLTSEQYEESAGEILGFLGALLRLGQQNLLRQELEAQ